VCDAVISNIFPMKQSDPEGSDEAQWVLEHLAGALESRRQQAACGRPLRTILLTRVLGALPPPGTRTVRAGSVGWIELAPGVSINPLRIDHETDNMTAYVRMLPGAVFAAHRHSQAEECLVIEGEIYIGTYCLRAGDMHFAACGTEHAMVTSPRGALMLVRCQAVDVGRTS
jgi:anti-sigma factor ChrR (cupin superfamily)